MSLEKKIIAAALSSRGAFTRISAAANIDSSFTAYSSFLLRLVQRYYDRDEKAEKVDSDILEEWIRQEVAPKNVDLYVGFLKECRALNVSAINVADVVVETRRQNIGNQLAAALMSKDSTKEKIAELLEQYQSLEEVDEKEEEEEYNNVSVATTVAEATDTAEHIKILPNELNRIIKGKLRRGHHIVVYARPETGKTAITLTMTWGFCIQGLTGIIFGNEEPVKDTILRAQCCFTGMTEEEIIAEPDKAQERLDKRGWNNIRFIPLNPGTPREINKYLERYKPDFFIVDQIRNLYVGGETRVNQLEMAATAMRNLGKKHKCVAISVTQAGDSADNKLVLDMGDIDFSNTGIPATADLMLGMGVNKEYEAGGLRMLSTPKNKIGGVHQNCPVRINQAISRIEDT